jgi:hypothetical protein
MNMLGVFAIFILTVPIKIAMRMVGVFNLFKKSQCGLSQIGWTITMLETTTQSQMLVISIRYAIYISTCLLFRYSLFHSKCYILLGKRTMLPNMDHPQVV